MSFTYNPTWNFTPDLRRSLGTSKTVIMGGGGRRVGTKPEAGGSQDLAVNGLHVSVV